MRRFFVVYQEGYRTETVVAQTMRVQDGCLVFSDGDLMIAVLNAGNWFSANLLNDTEPAGASE